MADPTIGVNIDDLLVPVKEALRQAARLACDAVELGGDTGPLSPANLSDSGRRHLRRYVEGLGMRLVGLTADVPGARINDPATVQRRVDATCSVLEVARRMNIGVVSASVGSLTVSGSDEPSSVAVDALRQIGECADSQGVQYAIRPSYDAGDRLRGVLERLACPAVRICLDPAAMVMAGANPLASVERFIEQVVLLYARDGSAGFVDPQGHHTHLGHEAPLGVGDVDLRAVIDVLREAEFSGPYILRRTNSSSPLRDLQADRSTLQRLCMER